MNKNYISLEIGGRKRGLKFDIGAKEIALEISNQIEATSHVQPVSMMIYSGLMANCEIKGEEPDFTLDDVKKWVRRMDQETYNEVAAAWHKAFDIPLPANLQSASGEGGKNTQEEASSVA